MKGGLKTIFSLLSFVIACAVSFAFYSQLAITLFNANFLNAPLVNGVNDILSGLSKSLTQQVFGSTGEMIDFLRQTDLPYYGKSMLISLLSNISVDGEFTISKVVATPLYKISLEVISFALIFIVSFVLLKILQHYLLKITNFSFIRVTDKVLGFIIGTGFGVIVYFVLVYFLVQLSHVFLSDWIIKKSTKVIYRRFSIKRLQADLFVKNIFNLAVVAIGFVSFAFDYGRCDAHCDNRSKCKPKQAPQQNFNEFSFFVFFHLLHYNTFGREMQKNFLEWCVPKLLSR